jgi:hypothetical protein
MRYKRESRLINLKMESMCSSKTLVYLQRTTGSYIPEDGTLHNHRRESLRSCIIGVLLVTSARVRARGGKLKRSAGEKQSRSGHCKVFFVFNLCNKLTNVMETANFQTTDELCTRCP